MRIYVHSCFTADKAQHSTAKRKRGWLGLAYGGTVNKQQDEWCTLDSITC